MTEIEKLAIKVLDNKLGVGLLGELQKALFHESPRDPSNTNEYILIEGKRQVVRDLIAIIENKRTNDE